MKVKPEWDQFLMRLYQILKILMTVLKFKYERFILTYCFRVRSHVNIF